MKSIRFCYTINFSYLLRLTKTNFVFKMCWLFLFERINRTFKILNLRLQIQLFLYRIDSPCCLIVVCNFWNTWLQRYSIYILRIWCHLSYNIARNCTCKYTIRKNFELLILSGVLIKIYWIKIGLITCPYTLLLLSQNLLVITIRSLMKSFVFLYVIH